MACPVKVLIVDDSPSNLFALKIFLKNIDAEFVEASNGHDALQETLKHDFAVAILDVSMPEMDGYELARRIRKRKRTEDLPIIFLSAVYSDNYHVFKGYNSGAVDFLPKPFMPEVLTDKVLFFIKIYKQQVKLRKTIRALERTKVLVLEQNKILEELASQDMLTGLYNRRQLAKILKQEAEKSRCSGGDLSIIILDLDHFKKVNDTYGHDFGDYVIKEFAARILSCISDSDFAFRFGGEEFIVLLPQTDLHGATATAENIRRLCADKLFQNLPHTISMTVSIGVSSYRNNPPKQHKDMIRHADIALYHAKGNGRNRVSVYSGLIKPNASL
ncbi:diguanylate cyclase [Candidatus Electronema sp. PJ]|uniref:GGDEF domain-containing response regulator n=1 Tax=Candidatus Electronema sp. PJ TaxID=3401572 RepID=UPI003AA9D52E